MTKFDDIEQRAWEPSDMMLVGESLLGAMVADGVVSEAWETDAFLDMTRAECQDAMRRMWEEGKRMTLAFNSRRFYLLNIERNAS